MQIPVVFCFDNNYATHVYITILSLEHYAREQTKYNVYCIINRDLSDNNRARIKSLSSSNIEICFIQAKNTFENSHQHRGITESAYYRLMLHDLLPNEEKVIYLDVDVLVNGDLTELYNVDISEYILGGVKNLYIHQVFEKHLKNLDYWKEKFSTAKYTYINSGVLLINLHRIRTTEIWEEWLELSKGKWEYHDQDILNMSCEGRILYLPPKYNATYPIRAKGADLWDLFTKEELSKTPVIYHFTATKPWDSKYMSQSKVWWDFVRKHTGQYGFYLKRYKKLDTYKRKADRLLLKGRRIFTKLITKNITIK